MRTSNLPAPWMIDEIERMRRIRETGAGEQAQIPLYPPEPPPPSHRPSEEPARRSCVIVIDLC